MSFPRFEWDEKKEQANRKKHGISFNEARTVFMDEEAVLFDDPVHSSQEDRFLIIGMSHYARVLTVCHCYRGPEGIIRLISARKATNKEIQQYIKVKRGWEEA